MKENQEQEARNLWMTRGALDFRASVKKRRAKNKVARASRKANRLRKVNR